MKKLVIEREVRNKPESICSLMSWICIPWPTPLTKCSHWSSIMPPIFSFIFFLILTTAFTCITSLSLPLPPLVPRGTEPLLSLLSNGDDVADVWLSPPLIIAWICTLRHPIPREMYLRSLLSLPPATTLGDRKGNELDFTAYIFVGWQCVALPLTEKCVYAVYFLL